MLFSIFEKMNLSLQFNPAAGDLRIVVLEVAVVRTIVLSMALPLNYRYLVEHLSFNMPGKSRILSGK